MPMPSSPPTSPPSLPSVRRSGARRFWIALGWYALGAVLLIAAFYLEENWRGARAWAACQRDLQAKGESLDWNTFIPPPVPDERNLAMAPLFVRQLLYRADPKTHAYTFGPVAEYPTDLKDMPFGGPKPENVSSSGWRFAKRSDLPTYQRHYRKNAAFPHADQPQSPEADVLLALTRYQPALDELAQAAAERPLTRFPVDWRLDNVFAIRLPHYDLEQRLVSALRMRASAQLAAGHSAEALRDMELGFRLIRDMRGDPTLIAHLVQITCLNVLLASIWEGLADRRWSAAELARLQADLGQFDMLADYVGAMRRERAYDLRGIDYFKNGRRIPFSQPVDYQTTSGMLNILTQILCVIYPNGWYDLNKVTMARFEQAYLVEVVDPKTRRFLPDKTAAGERLLTAMRRTPTNILAKLMLPVLNGITRKPALAQTGLDAAATACALERFYLDRQAYPARLDELVPAYLERIPTDVIDGAPLRYQPTPDGRYRIWGVGWNARDDDGKVVWQSAGKLNDDEGDWVWQYTEPQPLAQDKS